MPDPLQCSIRSRRPHAASRVDYVMHLPMRLAGSGALVAMCAWLVGGMAQDARPFKAIAFYTGVNDLAHISFVHEANRWFPELARMHHFTYESTTDWTRLNADVLAGYQVVIFLDTRPEDSAQREAFRKYMESGGAWLGFHFSGFALTPVQISAELGAGTTTSFSVPART